MNIIILSMLIFSAYQTTIYAADKNNQTPRQHRAAATAFPESFVAQPALAPNELSANEQPAASEVLAVALPNANAYPQNVNSPAPRALTEAADGRMSLLDNTTSESTDTQAQTTAPSQPTLQEPRKNPQRPLSVEELSAAAARERARIAREQEALLIATQDPSRRKPEEITLILKPGLKKQHNIF